MSRPLEFFLMVLLLLAGCLVGLLRVVAWPCRWPELPVNCEVSRSFFLMTRPSQRFAERQALVEEAEEVKWLARWLWIDYSLSLWLLALTTRQTCIFEGQDQILNTVLSLRRYTHISPWTRRTALLTSREESKVCLRERTGRSTSSSFLCDTGTPPALLTTP